ncbi:MAG: DUF1232 domain-containing protein [Syntrophomonadaceae bacterium]
MLFNREILRNEAARLKKELHAIYLASRHPGTPWQARALAGLALALAVSPIDLIPDFIPVLGYLDDLILIPWLLRLALKRIPDEVMKECRLEAEQSWQSGWGRLWAAALIAIIWLVIIGLAVKGLTAWYRAGR